MVTTVKENPESYTSREIKRATQARRLMAIIGRPSDHRMRQILSKKKLLNFEVAEDDVRNALNIYGPDLGSLKGKTTRRSEPHVKLKTRPIPPEIMKCHREVVACFDVMFVNSIALAVSISRMLKFGTAEALKNRKTETLMKSINRIQASYVRRGFLVKQVAVDNEFATLEESLSNAGIELNIVSRDEQVPEI